MNKHLIVDFDRHETEDSEHQDALLIDDPDLDEDDKKWMEESLEEVTCDFLYF